MTGSAPVIISSNSSCKSSARKAGSRALGWPPLSRVGWWLPGSWVASLGGPWCSGRRTESSGGRGGERRDDEQSRTCSPLTSSGGDLRGAGGWRGQGSWRGATASMIPGRSWTLMPLCVCVCVRAVCCYWDWGIKNTIMAHKEHNTHTASPTSRQC